MSDPQERQALIEELVRRYRRSLEAGLPPSSRTLDEIEEVASEIGGRVSREVQERLAQPPPSPRPERADCSCGRPARYKGVQPRALVTLHGELRLARAVSHCRACGKSFAPRDVALGLGAGCATARVRQHAAYLAALLPFATAATTLELLARVRLSAPTLERVACEVGNALCARRQEQTASYRAGRLPEPPAPGPRRLYIGMDGVFVPLRDAWKKDGSAGGLTCRYGECKLGVVYAATQDAQGRDCGVAARAYTATLGNADAFGPHLGALAHQEGLPLCRDVAVLADGAAWLWQVAAKQFPGATQIVDFYHASQHLARVAEARFGEGSTEGEAWLRGRQSELLADQMPLVLAHIQAWQPKTATKRDLRRTTYLYFANNAERMRYKRLREKGYFIGSGVVEAGCKQVVTQRMKLSGMHWRAETAEAMLALRALHLATRPPDLRPFCAMPA